MLQDPPVFVMVANLMSSSPLLKSVTAAVPTLLPSKRDPVSDRGYGQVEGILNVRKCQSARMDSFLSCFVDTMAHATMNEQKLSKTSISL